MSAEERLKKIIAFAEAQRDLAIAENPDYAPRLKYRWQHTLRVTQYGKMLAEKENADPEQVLAACLLHDIAKLRDRSRDVDHGRVGAKMVRPFLAEIGYTEAKRENICYAIATHVDGKADFEHPHSVEAMVVSDADKIDRFSGYRIFFGLREALLDEYEAFILAVRKQLARLGKAQQKVLIQTKSGKELFDEQISTQIAYLERFIADYEKTVLPKF